MPNSCGVRSENICKKWSATPHGRAQVITIGPFLLLTHEATHARWSRPLYQGSSGGPTARTVGLGAAVARRASEVRDRVDCVLRARKPAAAGTTLPRRGGVGPRW